MHNYNQLLTGVSVRHLTFTTGNSNSIQLGGSGTANTFTSATFIVNFTTTAKSGIKIQESSDGTNWTDLTVGYQTSSAAGVPISTAPANPGSAITSVANTMVANKFLAISVNRQGRETTPAALTVPLSSNTYLRVVATDNSANIGYGLALLHNPVFTPVAQPDVVLETKGTN